MLALKLQPHRAAGMVSPVRLVDEAQADAHVCRLEVLALLEQQ